MIVDAAGTRTRYERPNVFSERLTPMKSLFRAALLLTVSMALFAHGIRGAESTATVSLFKTPPTIDGRIEDGEWDGAVATTGFQTLRKDLLEARGGRSYCGYGKKRLYLAMVSELPPDGELVANKTARDSRTVFDDSVEIWLDPYEGDSGGGTYFQFIGNSRGAILDKKFDEEKGAPDAGWNADWEFANHIDPERGVWTAEVSIPFEDLGWEGSPVGRSIGVLLARQFKRSWGSVTWFPHQGAFVTWPEYPRIRLTPNDPSVQILSLGENVHRGELELEAKVHNPGPRREAKVKLDITSTDMPALSDEKTLTLPEKGSKTYTFRVSEGRLHETAKHTMKLRVSSAEGGRDYLVYGLKWTKAPDKAWNVRVGPNPEAACRLAYYPSYGLIRLRMDTGELEEEAQKITSAAVSVTGPDGEALLDERMEWEESPSEGTFEIGELPDGKYVTRIILKGNGYERTFERTFRRTHFVWENNRLGITDRVYPPFRPIEVKDREVAVVMRRYGIGGLGLWNSVQARGNESPFRELLAAPISLKINGDQTLGGTGKFTRTEDHEVIYEGRAEHPGATVTTRTTTEYDGCMKVELTLSPPDTRHATPDTQQTPLDTLSLEIPLKNEVAPLFHACTTHIRRNPAGRAPAGTGRVWDGRDFPNGEWYGNFHPYLWLGAEERGLCWFADNDRGWVLNVDPDEPSNSTPGQELIREDGVLTLRVNLVQKPVTLEEPRTIVFGLMASPGKPMPEGWRRHTFGQRIPGTRDIGWMGSTYWGCAESMAETYPLNRDFSILSKMQEVRLNGSMAGSDEFLRAWSQRHLTGDWPESGRKLYTKEKSRKLAEISLRTVRHQPDFYSVYWEEFKNVSRNHPETQVFGNEWSGRYRIGGIASLAPSYLDFQAWYGAEFIRRGIGLYWDNTFPRQAHDPITTDAYRLPNGRIRASANMWRRREYFKRLWVLHQQLAPAETKPIMMFHMTNSHLLPTMTFGQTNLDLEWFYGPRPAQSKYPADMLRTQTLGLQTGNIPLVLARVAGSIGQWRKLTEEQQHVGSRTKIGVMAVHEVRAGSRHGPSNDLLKRMYEFGYGRPGCEVYNYWQEDPPVRVSDQQCKWLLLQRDGRLMLLLCTWNENEADLDVTIDTRALGVDVSRAVNVETDETAKAAGGDFPLTMPGYGVRLFLLE